MGFLGNRSPPRSSTEDKRATGPSLPSINGKPAPANVKTQVGGPVVCPHCGKDTTQPPVRSDPQVIRMMFDELESAEGLTAWEDKFIDDVQKSYDKYGSLTPKQQATLEKIHTDKVVNGGRYIPGR